jgi:hypothetical protein
LGSKLEKPKIFHHMAHAGQRQRERGFDPATMESVVLKPDILRRCGIGVHGGNRYLLKKKLGDKTLVVIAECKADICWLITGYYE